MPKPAIHELPTDKLVTKARAALEDLSNIILGDIDMATHIDKRGLLDDIGDFITVLEARTKGAPLLPPAPGQTRIVCTTDNETVGKIFFNKLEWLAEDIGAHGDEHEFEFHLVMETGESPIPSKGVAAVKKKIPRKKAKK